ncbi:MAG: PepSY-associated TM helix domain-containing protein [Acidobacteriia bacterium]|nr:PepSY-associated TM helix domain-containing protein [Terriglobia bacterium]
MPNSAGGEANETARPAPLNPRYLHWKRRFAHLARWLHTYLSMLSFALLLFFAVTGLTLNHAEWFDSHERPAEFHGTLNKDWVNPSGSAGVAKDEIVSYFRTTYRTRGALSDFHLDADQCEVLFKGPGYEADATIDRATGKYDVTISPFSLVALLNDLHKGRDTGKKWSIVIDFSAVLMTLVSLTGLTLIFFLNKRRFSGLVLIAVGALLSWLVYSLWVS